jgi:hypothetical protein
MEEKYTHRHFQLVRISYQKLDFHGISRFSAVFIINNLNAWRYKSRTMETKSLFRLSFNRFDKKKTPTLALVYSWFLICTSELWDYWWWKQQKKEWFHENPFFDMIFWLIGTALKCLVIIFLPYILKWSC